MTRLKLFLSLAIVGLSLYLAREPLLVASANYLVRTDAPTKADLIVVLGGDTRGFRASKGCELLQAGYAQELWLSGAQEFFGLFESEAARDYLIRKGCPGERIRALRLPVDSTRDEAKLIGKQMRDKGIRKYLLVSSNFHTRRAGFVFRQENPELEAVVIAAEGDDFEAENWWKQRHSQRTFFNEWTKTISYWVGL